MKLFEINLNYVFSLLNMTRLLKRNHELQLYSEQQQQQKKTKTRNNII